MAFLPGEPIGSVLEIPLVVLLCRRTAWAEISSLAIRAELMASVEKSGGYASQTNVVGRKHAAGSQLYAGPSQADRVIASHTSMPRTSKIGTGANVPQSSVTVSGGKVF
jgi:hypothetical protein